jgi:hypothetical protein
VCSLSHLVICPTEGGRPVTRADSSQLDCFAAARGDDFRILYTALNFGRCDIEQFVSQMITPPNKSLEPTAAPLLGLARLPFRATGSSGCGSALIR